MGAKLEIFYIKKVKEFIQENIQELLIQIRMLISKNIDLFRILTYVRYKNFFNFKEQFCKTTNTVITALTVVSFVIII